ncbi:hypothetical protein [Sphingobacterium sp. ML3W]
MATIVVTLAIFSSANTQNKQKPMVIEEQGSFAIGGTKKMEEGSSISVMA